MKRAYLFLYDDQVGTRAEVKAFLNSMDEVITWRYDMPHSFIIISESSADVLTRALRKITGDKGMFLFTQFSGNEQGLLTTESWYLINNKAHKPKKDS